MSEKRKRLKQIKVIYRQVPGISEEEAQQRLDQAFEVVIESMLKNWDKLKSEKMDKNF